MGSKKDALGPRAQGHGLPTSCWCSHSHPLSKKSEPQYHLHFTFVAINMNRHRALYGRTRICISNSMGTARRHSWHGWAGGQSETCAETNWWASTKGSAFPFVQSVSLVSLRGRSQNRASYFLELELWKKLCLFVWLVFLVTDHQGDTAIWGHLIATHKLAIWRSFSTSNLNLSNWRLKYRQYAF